MKPETRLGKRLAEKLDLDIWHRVENSAMAGTPDVYYQHGQTVGWIELKHVKDFPARPTTPIRFHRFTSEQANTIHDFGFYGARSFVLAQVGIDHYLFNWDAARELRLGQPKHWWDAHCRAAWKTRCDYLQLRHILSQ